MTEKRAIIPNTFTMTNMVLGFIAIIMASRGNPESIAIAGVLVFVASFFDFIDGATARALKVTSPIGIQLDSLADEIAYGIAPGFIAYQAYLSKMPDAGFLGLNWGMIIAPIFPICATYRLAKFNIEGSGKKGFTGLPSPAAGIFIASIPALPFSRIPFIGKINFQFPIELFVPIFAIVALLMVSEVDYMKLFSDIASKGKAAIMITTVINILLLYYFNMWSVFAFTSLYIMAGIVFYIYRCIWKKECSEES
ncbi:MAG: CDP-diacylglycerol--serine O-phosphatidyltransferase [Spirochaetae bacterium HGW-Spirochaetae-1]|nr:MAG: CDP-diacylglycerol--serine O-phosphatidyltransferase [Spirochaetae bacterium HGW-Spirochaetae-1]